MEFESNPSLKQRLVDLFHEGNARHVVVHKEGRSIADLPLTIVVVGTLLAPWLAALLALIALLTGYRIEMRREAEKDAATAPPPPAAPEAPAPPDEMPQGESGLG